MSRSKVRVSNLNFGHGNIGIGFSIPMPKEHHMVASVSAWRDGTVTCQFYQLPEHVICMDSAEVADRTLAAYHDAIELANKQYWEFKNGKA